MSCSDGCSARASFGSTARDAPARANMKTTFENRRPTRMLESYQRWSCYVRSVRFGVATALVVAIVSGLAGGGCALLLGLEDTALRPGGPDGGRPPPPDGGGPNDDASDNVGGRL